MSRRKCVFGSISPFGPLTPAAFTSTSRRPCSDATRSNAAFTWALSETSTTCVDTPSIPRAVSSSPASSMSTATTVAPSSAHRCVVARPIPDPPPVTRAILSFSSIPSLSSVEADRLCSGAQADRRDRTLARRARLEPLDPRRDRREALRVPEPDDVGRERSHDHVRDGQRVAHEELATVQRALDHLEALAQHRAGRRHRLRVGRSVRQQREERGLDLGHREEDPLVDERALPRSRRRDEPRVRHQIGDVHAHRGGLVQDAVVVLQHRHPAQRVALEVLGGARLVHVQADDLEGGARLLEDPGGPHGAAGLRSVVEADHRRQPTDRARARPRRGLGGAGAWDGWVKIDGVTTILVTGATGNVGGALVGALRGDGLDVRALVRDPSRASLPEGVETIAGDLPRPADWAGALQGVDGVFLLSGYDGMTDLLAGARDAGVRRAVLLSGSSVEGGDLDNAVTRYQAQAEAHVEASGLDATFLRPNSFMTNALEWAGQIRAGDVVRAPFSGVRVGMIDPADIAAVAAHALVEGDLGGRALRLSGPESLAPGDRVRILGEVLGRDLRYEAQSDSEAAAQMRATLPAGYAEAFLSFFVRGTLDESVVQPTVRAVLGREPTTFAAWVQAHRDAFA